MWCTKIYQVLEWHHYTDNGYNFSGALICKFTEVENKLAGLTSNIKVLLFILITFVIEVYFFTYHLWFCNVFGEQNSEFLQPYGFALYFCQNWRKLDCCSHDDSSVILAVSWSETSTSCVINWYCYVNCIFQFFS